MRLWIPGKITSERNRGRGKIWQAVGRRNAQRRQDVLWAWRAALADGQVLPPAPWCVTLVRQSPRQLDSDNLGDAFKATRDEVANCLGLRSDVEKTVWWRYAQRRGEAGIEITVETLTPAVASREGAKVLSEGLAMIERAERARHGKQAR